MTRLIIFILSVMLLLVTGARANELLKALEKNKNKTTYEKDEIIVKEFILNCKFAESLEYSNNNLIKTYSRNQLGNPQVLDGYFHYNQKQKFIVSNLGRLNEYGKIFEGINSKTTLDKSFGEQVLSFFITFGSNSSGSPFDDRRIQNSFSFDKYDLRMTFSEYIIGKSDKKKLIRNYQCEKTTKAIP